VTTSETKISCVIDRAAQGLAVAAIKEAFQL
jgi:aspartokinase